MLKKVFGIIVVLVSCFVFVTTASAQDEAPEEVNLVIETLGNALGVVIDPATVDNVVWRNVVYSTSALGCPFPQTQYEVIDAPGYQILLDYENVRYDYRVTTGGEYVILCGTQASTFVVPEEPVVEVVSTEVVPVGADDEVCSFALRPRLTIGEIARTTPELGSNLRDLPDLDATDLGTIPESSMFTVVGGPECGADGYYWWQVDYAGTIGWVSQGQDGLYFVEPIPVPLVLSTSPFSLATLELGTLLSEIEGNLLEDAAWSPDGERIIIPDASTANSALWVYFVGDLSQVPVSVTTDFNATALAFTPDGSVLVAGDEDGALYYLDADTFNILGTVDTGDAAIRDIDFSPTGAYMLVLDEEYTAKIYGVPAQ